MQAEETLSLRVATEIAERLANIPGFIGRPGALKGLTELLWKLCRGFDLAGRHWTPEEQARWLGDEAAEHWTKWASEAALKLMFETKFPPYYHAGNEMQILGEKPLIQCELCSDLGWTESNGHYVWCVCRQAKRLCEENPALLEFMERQHLHAMRQNRRLLPACSSLRFIGNHAVCSPERRKKRKH